MLAGFIRLTTVLFFDSLYPLAVSVPLSPFLQVHSSFSAAGYETHLHHGNAFST